MRSRRPSGCSIPSRRSSDGLRAPLPRRGEGRRPPPWDDDRGPGVPRLPAKRGAPDARAERGLRPHGDRLLPGGRPLRNPVLGPDDGPFHRVRLRLRGAGDDRLPSAAQEGERLNLWALLSAFAVLAAGIPPIYFAIRLRGSRASF